MAFTTQPKERGAMESSGGTISPTVLRRLLSGAGCIPALRRKYAGWLEPDALPALGSLPVLTRSEYAAATSELLRARAQDTGSVVYAGGGTTSQPSLTVLPGNLFVDEICGSWRPLDATDVVANLFPAATLWPTHCFYNRLTIRCGATALPLGDLSDDKLDRLLASLDEFGVTALVAPPSRVRRLLRRFAAGRPPLRSLRKLITGGPFHDPTPRHEILRHLPDVEVWQLYGSSEAWIVGHQGPRCDEGVYHLLPHQHAEIAEGRVLVTTTGGRRTPPLIRYAIGERGEFTVCGCGQAAPALRLEAEAPDGATVNGRPVLENELVRLARETGDVADADVVTEPAFMGGERMVLRVRLADGVPNDEHTLEWIKYHVLSSHLALDPASADHSDLLQVVTVDHC